MEPWTPSTEERGDAAFPDQSLLHLVTGHRSLAELEAFYADCLVTSDETRSVLEALFFYHPALWWVSSRLREEREHCCDDVASSITGGALPYARALTASKPQANTAA